MAEVPDAMVQEWASDTNTAFKTFTAQLGEDEYNMPAPLQGAAPGAQLANAYTQGFTAGTGKVLQAAGASSSLATIWGSKNPKSASRLDTARGMKLMLPT